MTDSDTTDASDGPDTDPETDSDSDAVDDPYVGGDSGDGDADHRVFWADAVADEVEARDPEGPIVIKGGISPSGVPHLGNMNEIMRGHFVAEVLRERGRAVRQLFTADDRDPLRGLPRKLADLDGEIADLGDVDAGALGRNLGHPYTDIPDPFGCCVSYAAHFSELILRSAEQLGADVEIVSTSDLYESGALEEPTRRLLADRERAREVLAEYQARVDADYVPFNPVCTNCGKITETVTAVRPEAGEVDYRCTDLEAGEQVIEGCGHEGTATLREGKLPWRFEWPAQWNVLDVDFEPFGKDHAEGSWPSGQQIARDLLDVEPPVPMVYEWFTLGGEPFSSSAGNVILVSELLELIEPEVLRYFFAKDPRKARDLDRSRIDRLVAEFDRLERVARGEREADPAERAFAERVYPFLVEDPDAERLRIPYTFAAVLGMTDDRDLRIEMARNEEHLSPDASDRAIERALERVERARTWAERMDNEYNYRIQADLPDVEVDAATAAALDDLADFVAAGRDGEAIQAEIYETAKRHDLDVGAFFGAGYELFFGQDSGPQLGPLLGSLDREFVVRRLRREG
jgi:lysyl-tRNA synthetase class 1